MNGEDRQKSKASAPE
ncbi:hypothetical protein YPPY47_1141, partial [Yersinia pestis PY-47]